MRISDWSSEVCSSVLLLALAGGFGDCRAEDVAQAGTGLGGAILGHRFLLLGDLALLDRQGDLAGLRIDRGDAGVDLLADSEAARMLRAAVTRPLRLPAAAPHAVPRLPPEPGVGYRLHR